MSAVASLTATGVLATEMPDPRLAQKSYPGLSSRISLTSCATRAYVNVVVACAVVADVFERLWKRVYQLRIEGASIL